MDTNCHLRSSCVPPFRLLGFKIHKFVVTKFHFYIAKFFPRNVSATWKSALLLRGLMFASYTSVILK